jgi:type III pantothenate kinase
MSTIYDILAIDVGNTNVVLGYFKNQTLKAKTRIPTENFQLPDVNPASKIVVSSVVPKVDPIIKQLKPKPLFINSKTIPLLTINIDKPKEAGADRIVNAFGAYQIYNSDCIILDFGTATTACLVRKEGIYEGGAILAGIRISLQALHAQTAKLPLLKSFDVPKSFIGKNTKDSILFGQYWGHVGALKEYIRLFKQKAPEAKVIATGGYAKLFSQNISEVDFIEEELTLKSLEMIGRKS